MRNDHASYTVLQTYESQLTSFQPSSVVFTTLTRGPSPPWYSSNKSSIFLTPGFFPRVSKCAATRASIPSLVCTFPTSSDLVTSVRAPTVRAIASRTTSTLATSKQTSGATGTAATSIEVGPPLQVGAQGLRRPMREWLGCMYERICQSVAVQSYFPRSR